MNAVKLCVESRRTATVKTLLPATPDTVNNKEALRVIEWVDFSIESISQPLGERA